MVSFRCILLLTMSTLVYSDDLIDQLDFLMAGALPELAGSVQDAIPDSYGKCDSKSPDPCEGSSSIYYKHKSWVYKVDARWISGLKTISFTQAVSARNTDTPGVSIRIDGYFGELPLSLYIGQCVTFDICTKIWDNTNACCGSKEFSLNISMVCASSGGGGPIDHLEMMSVDTDKFEINEDILGIGITVADITSKVQNQVESMLTDYITTETIYPGGKTLVEWLNSIDEINQATNYICTEMRTDILVPGESLKQGERLTSIDSDVTLKLQGDGNLVIYTGSSPVWASHTVKTPGTHLDFQSGDGNLVLYDSEEKTVWSSGKYSGAAKIVLEKDCNLVMYDSDANVLWSTGTSCSSLVVV